MSLWIARFGAAVSFLTICPLPVRDRNAFARSAMCFPFVGLLMGLALWGVHALLKPFCEAWAIALALLALGIVLTRALHLDGLADSVDGVLSHQSRQRMLEIMRDSRIGTMGAVALILDVLMRYQILSHMPSDAMGLALVVACSLGRMAMAAGMIVFPYAREGGLVTAFMQGLQKKDIFFVLAAGALIALACLGVRGVLIWSVALLVCVVAGTWFRKCLGGFTGDTLGAMNEMVEIACLGMIAAGL